MIYLLTGAAFTRLNKLVTKLPKNNVVVNVTTRQPRAYEVNHRNYHFLTTKWFNSTPKIVSMQVNDVAVGIPKVELEWKLQQPGPTIITANLPMATALLTTVNAVSNKLLPVIVTDEQRHSKLTSRLLRILRQQHRLFIDLDSTAMTNRELLTNIATVCGIICDD